MTLVQGAMIILTTSVMAVVGLLTTGVDAGLVGLVLSYALNITGSLVSF
jgi:ATP-binding cassette subfamily C (CFTR/MRP) protein 1